MATKLLLIDDVEDLGRSGDIVSVKPGYARNLLLPRGFAVLADKSALRMQARLQEERRKKAIVDKKESEEFAARVNGQTVTTIVKVDQEGHMYGSVSIADIVHLLHDQLSITVEKRTVQLKHPIKEVGVFDLILKLNEGISSTFHLKVVPEELKGHHAPAAPKE